ncbi:hypothetical protein SCALIN_C14_0058 [Candidatus Scalindua japonica]|uniref:Uncharacterized protein n=1 Tax=Candidatus Scalindua japonica TaxID=1284222 RepID=A0A286TY30_9BACT|nr:hypothetical protein [Candidatus Scalindua japonica]GAX60792.1 hypothetical protein SCALIN_C14_0058 [Candidatus Scalindua japonica]
MQKKSVLGSDPLKWLKEENKKENAESQKGDIGSQEKQAEKSPEIVNDKQKTGVEHEKKQEKQACEPINVSDTLKQERNKSDRSDNVKGSSRLRQEETFESSDITEINRKTVLGKDAYGYSTKSRDTVQKDSPATAFVIVYTVLLLILGFIVYRDLTKQINKLETKLQIVEKQLDEGLINYEDTKLDDVW